jgi:glucose-1-phosphate adenylyltransferase
VVGEGNGLAVANREEPSRMNTGITLVGKRAVIPRSVRIGRNVRIAEGTRAADFGRRVVRSGESVGPRTRAEVAAVAASQ